MIGAIIQARVGSARFHGKVLKVVLGKTLIEHEVLRVRKSRLVDKIVLATTEKSEDDKIEKIAKRLNVGIFRGSENNVLDRYFRAAKEYRIDTIVRMTGDCPLIDAKIIDEVISLFLKKKVDFVSNVDPPTYPDGMDVEVFSFAALERVHNLMILPSDREHVTSYIKRHKKKFQQLNLKSKSNLSNLRLTLDYPSDLLTIRKIYKHFYRENKYFGMDKIVELYFNEPDLFKSNKNIVRNLGYKKSLKGNIKWLQ